MGYQVDGNEDLPTTSVTTEPSPSVENAPFNLFNWHYLNRQKNTNSASNAVEQVGALKKEMNQYQREDILPPYTNPYSYWSQHSARFPLLCIVAQKFLATPPSSIESERIFSIGGRIYSPQRGGRITGKTAESLMFCNYNLKYFKNKYSYNFSLWNQANKANK